MRPLDFADLMMVDDIVPSDFSPFRTIEYEHYLGFFNAALLSLEGWQAWIGNESFERLLERFPIDSALKSRIVPFRTHANIVARLAYVTFLGNAIRLVAFFEARGIPFILQLYPGGGFELDSPETDERLRRVLLSKLCRKVIVTQSITEQYILDKIGCDQGKVEHIFGGVFESRLPFSFNRDKAFYPKDKTTIDLCFVAHKYGGNITSKGYDQFVAIALELAGAVGHLRFHVVGDYLPGDVPLREFSSRFTFYGRRSSAFLADFYKSMDMIISINRPFDLTPGSFDGFPTGACIEAGFRGVLNCINDPLKLNPCLVDNQDIVLLNLDHQNSAARLRDLIENPPELYRIAEQGWHRFLDVFDTNRQLWARTRVIAAELTRHEGLIVRPAPDPSVLDSGSFRQVLLPYRERIALLEAANSQATPQATPESTQVAQYDAEALRLQVSTLEDQLTTMKSSTSWRLTAPLRRLLGQYPRLALFLRRGLKLIWWTLSLQLGSRYRAWSAVRGDVAKHRPTQGQLLAPAANEERLGSQPLLLQSQNANKAATTTD
jgi:glycosyltransferase involved in cell wall biosynthesis